MVKHLLHVPMCQMTLHSCVWQHSAELELNSLKHRLEEAARHLLASYLLTDICVYSFDCDCKVSVCAVAVLSWS